MIAPRLLFTAALLGLGGIAASIAGAQSAAPPSPAQIYGRECAICHAAGGTGTRMLARRMPADMAVLTDRPDLPAAYVKMVVRNGIGSMPAITRVEVTDAELDLIAAYLAKGEQ